MFRVCLVTWSMQWGSRDELDRLQFLKIRCHIFRPKMKFQAYYFFGTKNIAIEYLIKIEWRSRYKNTTWNHYR
jgi:hypothetical protein